jgi:hypothetical protein
VQLNLNPALNDAFANCLVITGLAGSVSGSTRGATRQGGEPLHAGVSGSGSIWYCWTAPSNAPFTFHTTGSSIDTLLGVYTGNAVNALTLVASDNDSGSNGSSRVTFNAVSNTLYRIAVEGVAGMTGVVKLAWSGPLPPGIVQQPLSTNAPAGSAVTFSAIASGTPPLGYQWRHQDTNLLSSASISGVTSPGLTLHKILPSQQGVYNVVITNAYGSVTSAPANLIVHDNPRVIFAEESFGHSGAPIRVPVEMQSLGNEHAVSFSLVFDPAILSNVRATNLPPGASLTLNTNQVASGALGVTLTLPASTTFGTGHVHVIDFVFDTQPSSEPVETFAGFGNLPVARSVSGTNGAALTALFVAGVIELTPLQLQTGSLSNGTYRLSFPAVDSYRYAIDASTDLVTWTPLVTNAPAGGQAEFMDTTGLPYRFYRLRLVP